MSQRGCIVSKVYENTNSDEVKNYYIDDHKLNINIKIIDGVIMFDERKSHIKNCEQILEHCYNTSKQFSYDDTWFLKTKLNNIDGKEMYYANYLASLGEPTILYGDYEEENKNIVTSTMLFLPKDINDLTPKQAHQIYEIISKRDENHFGAALCDGDVKNLEFKGKEEITRMLDIKKYIEGIGHLK